MSEQIKAGGFVTSVEQFNCPCCDTAIAREAVASNIRPQDYGDTKRVVKVYCDGCGKLFVGEFVLRGGNWEQQTVRAGTEKEREGFMKRLDHIRGNKYAEAVAG